MRLDARKNVQSQQWLGDPSELPRELRESRHQSILTSSAKLVRTECRWEKGLKKCVDPERRQKRTQTQLWMEALHNSQPGVLSRKETPVPKLFLHSKSGETKCLWFSNGPLELCEGKSGENVAKNKLK